MMQNSNNELKHTYKAVTTYTRELFKELSPMNNIRIMGTNVKGDILAGITVAVIALPLALAFGIGSGLGAITGIWGAIAGGIIGGLFGGSRIGVSGPTGPKMVQLASIMAGYRLASGEPDLGVAFTIIFLSGLLLVLISFLRVSRIIYLTPYSVIGGFMTAIGIIVIALEFNSFIGATPQHSVMEVVNYFPQAMHEISWQTLVISIPSLILLFSWNRLTRSIKFLNSIPAPLVVLTLGTATAIGFNLDTAYIGEIPTGLPKIYLPEISRFGEFLKPAAALAGLAIFDSLLTCIVNDHISGDKHSSDRETFGQGLANMTAGLFGGLTTATATMRSVANYVAGGKTPLASIVHGLVLLALVLGLGKYASNIPLAVLAAILIKVGIDIMDYRIIPVLHKLPLTDFIVFWAVLLVTLSKDLLAGMMIGIIIAVIRFAIEISKVYRPNITKLSQQQIGPMSKYDKHIEVLNLNGPMFFGSIESMDSAYNNLKDKNVLLIDLTNVSMIDLSGAFGLEDLMKKAQWDNIYIVITNAPNNVKNSLQKLQILNNSDFVRYIQNKDKAIQYTRELIKDILETTEETTLERIDKSLPEDFWYVIGD